MAPLVTVENDRNGGVQGLIHTREDKRHLQGLVQLPGHHIPGIPVHDRHQVHPAPEKADVGSGRRGPSPDPTPLKTDRATFTAVSLSFS